jgi:hypothetical protein
VRGLERIKFDHFTVTSTLKSCKLLHIFLLSLPFLSSQTKYTGKACFRALFLLCFHGRLHSLRHCHAVSELAHGSGIGMPVGVAVVTVATNLEAVQIGSGYRLAHMMYDGSFLLCRSLFKWRLCWGLQPFSPYMAGIGWFDTDRHFHVKTIIFFHVKEVRGLVRT